VKRRQALLQRAEWRFLLLRFLRLNQPQNKSSLMSRLIAVAVLDTASAPAEARAGTPRVNTGLRSCGTGLASCP